MAAASLCFPTAVLLQPAWTETAPHSASPLFRDTRTFDVLPTRRLLKAYAAKPLEFLVLDDSDASNRGGAMAPSASGILGRATVSLHQITRGGSINGRFNIVDDNQRVVGALEVRIQWRKPLQLASTLPSNRLMESEYSTLAQRFTHPTDVSWRVHCSLPRRQRLRALYVCFVYIAGRPHGH